MNGEIILCVYLRNMNQSCIKDRYPMSNMEQLLQVVVGVERISLLDGFS